MNTADANTGSNAKVVAIRLVLGIVVLGLLMSTFSRCGGEEPAGPDVRGLTLPDAKAKLEEAGVEATVHAKDAAFGVIVEDNFVVCHIEAVSEHLVRLEVAKHGC